MTTPFQRYMMFGKVPSPSQIREAHKDKANWLYLVNHFRRCGEILSRIDTSLPDIGAATELWVYLHHEDMSIHTRMFNGEVVELVILDGLPAARKEEQNEYGHPQMFELSEDSNKVRSWRPVCCSCYADVMPNRGEGMLCQNCFDIDNIHMHGR